MRLPLAILSVLAMLCCLRRANAGQVGTLPVFISDNHADSFTWFSQVLDLDEAATLLLVDHHSDASCVERSDDVREGLRRVASVEQRRERCEAWRSAGKIQAYNWIEPLMPRPFDQVIWLAREQFSGEEASELEQEAIDAVDGRLEFEKRSAGAMARRWHVVAADQLKALKLSPRPLVASIDLDYFMEMKSPEREQRFAKIWQWLIGQPNLCALSFCLSRPWLQDEAEAQALLRVTFQAVAGVRGVRFTIRSQVDVTPDDSLQALKLKGENQAVPRWDAAALPADLRSLCVRNQSCWHFQDQQRDWTSIMKSWESALLPCTLVLADAEADSDGIYRVAQTHESILRVRALPEKASGHVRWYALEPLHPAVDLLPATGLGKTFSTHPARWVAEGRVLLAETKDAAFQLSEAQVALGRHRYLAEIQVGDVWYPTPIIEIRRTEGSGFHAGLAECFRMPYVFGIALAQDDSQQGVETGWGSDCSNFLVHAWRRSGAPLAWGDPSQVAAQLQVMAEKLRVDFQLPLPAQAEQGVAVSFGNHMAALWQDVAPVGVLTADDVFVHHLGGVPEVLPLRKLMETRPSCSVLTLRDEATCEIAFVGDCVLAEASEAEVATWSKRCEGADVVLWNLEGVPTQRPPVNGVKYDFRFDPTKLAWLQQGVTAVSLANNHAGDAGVMGLADALKQCRDHEVKALGAGVEAQAVKPLHLTSKGVKLAVFGVCCVDALVATDASPGVASLPQHQELLSAEFRAAMAAGEVIVVFVHWGEEYETKVSATQHQLAQWFLEQGVTCVAGSHPHVVQRQEFTHGGFVAYSLGNAIYPEKLQGRDSGALLRIKITSSGRMLVLP